MNHYNAFISYKHAPEDNRVAEAVHKGLERFHIPGKIRKKTGIKRISRIFRDKDELPITSDLSDTIADALENSDYLIVICSTNTKESAWVPREIECFLKNHSKRDIFTVLVNGEPVDVIPEILKYDERVIKDENGNETKVQIPVEPLSCDYRESLRKAKKTELPRLASGIIGCAYDELMNRRRQYRIKQLTAGFVLALSLMAAFCGYMFYSRDRIHKSYLESLKNQSRYLANESKNLLGKEQRITALQLALEALPKDEADDRPVTAEAVRALTDATLAYEGMNGDNIHAAWNYQMPNVISDFKVSSDGKTIAIRDDGNVAGVWDTESHKNILYFDGEYERISGMGFLSDDRFVIWSGKRMDCYDTKTGSRLWDYAPDREDYTSFDDDGNLLVADDSFYIAMINNDFLKIDSATGKLIKKIPLSEESWSENTGIIRSRLSPDGKKIVFSALGGWSEYAYGVLDTETGKAALSDIFEEMIKAIEWIDNDTFMLADTLVDMKGSMSIGNREILSNDHSTVRCISASGMKEKWSRDFVCNGVVMGSGFLKLGDTVAFYSGNVITVYDIGTGQEKYTNNVNASVIDVSDRDGDGSPSYITENGCYAAPARSVNDDAVYRTRYFADDLRQVVLNKGVYARQQLGHEIIYYGTEEYDRDWTPLCEDVYLPDYSSKTYIDEEYLVLLSDGEADDSGEKTAMIDIFTLGEKAQHHQKKLEDGSTYQYTVLGIRDGKIILGHDMEKSCELVFLDPTGNIQEKKEIPEISMSFRDTLAAGDGRLYYSYRTEDYETAIGICDMDSGEKRELVLPEDTGYVNRASAYYEEIKTICTQGDKDLVTDIETGETAEIQVSEEWAGADCYSDHSADGLFAVSDGNRILLSDKKGIIKETIMCPGLSPMGMTFLDEDLLVLFNDGSLNRYSVKTGEFLKNIDVLVSYSYSGDVIFDYDRDNDLLYIQMDNMCDVVDLKNGYELASIYYCLGHNKTRDIFITTVKESGKGKQAGYFRHYTVQELTQKAHDILKDAVLSDEIKSRYGIE